ncbi:MAG: hypothetical protein FJW30_05780 [Acidobacteria bacterium]|nr:hypothetical protein [Acidobacteriota bacterium]
MHLFLLALAAVDFLHITDTHIIKRDGIHPEIWAQRKMYEHSIGELNKFVAGFRPGSAAFIVHTGDMVDAWCFETQDPAKPVYGQFEYYLQAVKPLPVPIHHVMGNHDVECYRRNPKDPSKPAGDQSVGDQTRSAWKRMVPALRKGTYYTVSKKAGRTRYRIAVLDNGQAIPPGSPEYLRGQMEWLSRQLKRHPRDTFILALHIPIGATPFSAALRTAVGDAKNVAMILCGHNHTDNIAQIELGASRPTQVRTSALFKGADQSRRIRLHPDRIEVSETAKPGTVAATIPVGKTP